jgi:heme/copper-type cytochrome/quinol oxidase subunit 4
MTIFSWALAEHGAPARLAATSVMLIAALKIRFVVADFMELDWRPLPWRIVFELWTVTITLMIVGGYWLTEL